ncbi:MAG: hypothetical protein HEQ20_07610 [Aphanizomenon flos-aquae KM1D3_PB]|uniref:hypothetical protein n=1 Tax=Aphanizomenon flos-aquae TaxID=1176 RepID=UPI0005434AB7|nr:hypothetical protein [Aphanizomenon flos-aquae]KHG42082.1 hypothetical protein OA07_07330 [Aphanizomenon flos-aquae 2012/KM1/D3]QSV70643.1 MAG: hypothetical protein HEQ20_07610 [Aphanizomenon flos-aquae KM1D3_PB]
MSQTSPEPIHYSSEAIRWCYGENTPSNQDNFFQITKWWTSLHGKRIKMRSITGTERYRVGERWLWKPIQEDPIQEFEIQNPQIDNEFLSFDGSSIEEPIKVQCVDFDMGQNQLIAEVNSAIKYVFTL